MFSFESDSPLPVSCAETCQGMAFDGCRYYLTIRRECAITILDRKFCPIKTVTTRRSYTAIAYDPKRDSFWAASDQCRGALFQLDRCLREIDRLDLRGEGCRFGTVTGISFCCESGHLLISCGNQLLEINMERGDACLLCETRGCTLILAVVCLPPYMIFSMLRGGTAYLVLACRDGRVLAEKKAQEALAAEAMVLDPCTYDLLMLTNKHGCYPHVIRICLGKKLRDTLCPCNGKLCCECGGRECRCCDEPCDCGNIPESIARVEAGIAHILNAEGEKLQAAIKCGTPPRELLKVNESVQRTMLYATQLEQALLAKLEMVCRCRESDRHCCEEVCFDTGRKSGTEPD